MGGIITHQAGRAIEQALQPRCRYLADILAGSTRPVGLWELVDRITPGSDDDGPVRTYICRIRAALGQDAIETVRLVGYQLTEKGRAAYDHICALEVQAALDRWSRPSKVEAK